MNLDVDIDKAVATALRATADKLSPQPKAGADATVQRLAAALTEANSLVVNPDSIYVSHQAASGGWRIVFRAATRRNVPSEPPWGDFVTYAIRLDVAERWDDNDG